MYLYIIRSKANVLDMLPQFENHCLLPIRPAYQHIRDLPTHREIVSFIWEGYRGGLSNFAYALLSNSLADTYARADSYNLLHLREWVHYLRDICPSECWGSPTKVQEWKGLFHFYGAERRSQ